MTCALPSGLDAYLREIGVLELHRPASLPEWGIPATHLDAHREWLRSGAVQSDGDSEGPY